MDAAMIINFQVEKNAPLVTRTAVTLFMKGDNEGNIIQAEMLDEGKPLALDGYSATLYLRRSDGKIIRNPASIAENMISVPLMEENFSVPGNYSAILRITSAESQKRTVLRFTGYIESDGEGPIIDPSGSIPTYDDIERIMQELEEALQDAKDATNDASDAATKANNNAKTAEEAASRANKAAKSIEGITATASSIAYSAPPTASVSEVDGHKNFDFGIPAGRPGTVPNLTFTANTGAPGTEVVVSQSGTPENPIVNLTIPRGSAGSGSVSSVNEIQPDENGNVTIGADSIKEGILALENGGTGATNPDGINQNIKAFHIVGSAADANTALTIGLYDTTSATKNLPSGLQYGNILNVSSAYIFNNKTGIIDQFFIPIGGGRIWRRSNYNENEWTEWTLVALDAYPVGSIYMSYDSTSPASLFGGKWTQIKDRFLVGVGSSYTAGATGGANSVTLTGANLPASQVPPVRSTDRFVTMCSEGDTPDGYITPASSGTLPIYWGGNWGTRALGDGSAHENRPPYFAVYMWRRTA